MLKTKVNKIDKKIPNATTLIYIIDTAQTNKIWRKKLDWNVDKKIPDVSGLVATTV